MSSVPEGNNLEGGDLSSSLLKTLFTIVAETLPVAANVRMVVSDSVTILPSVANSLASGDGALIRGSSYSGGMALCYY